MEDENGAVFRDFVSRTIRLLYVPPRPVPPSSGRGTKIDCVQTVPVAWGGEMWGARWAL